jgi:diguanylate cyclase (GGDEF)-like protein
MNTEHALELAQGQVLALRQALVGVLLELDANDRVLHAQVPQGAPLKRPAARWVGQTLAEVWSKETLPTCMAVVSEARRTGHSVGRRVSLSPPVPWREMWVEAFRCGRPGSRVLLVARETEPEHRVLQQLAFFDALTGLPNRRLLLDRLEQGLHDSHRTRQCGAVLFIDLDGFKGVNDSLGHAAGDQLLTQAGQRLSQVFRRSSDTVARLGGDEFVALLRHLGAGPATAYAHTQRVARQLVAVLNQPYLLTQGKTSLSASVGGVLYDGAATSTAETLLAQADRAMYRAKAAGRNTCWMDEPPLPGRAA